MTHAMEMQNTVVIFIVTAFVGFPKPLVAMEVAKEVFAEFKAEDVQSPASSKPNPYAFQSNQRRERATVRFVH